MARGFSLVPEQKIDTTNRPRIRSTTVICVRRNGQVVMAADGQVTLGDHVLKHSAKKIRRLYQDKILAGFAGSTADAFALNQGNEKLVATMQATIMNMVTQA